MRTPIKPMAVRIPFFAPNSRFAVFGNEFGIMVNISDYDTETHIQTKKATYKDIQAWVMDQYGEQVTNLDISRAKKRCELTQYEYKGHKASEGYYIPKPRECKEQMVMDAFIHFHYRSQTSPRKPPVVVNRSSKNGQ